MISVYVIVIIVILIQGFVAIDKYTKSMEELGLDYEDEKNAMIAITTEENNNYEDFYEDFDNRIDTENSMDIIFFGPPSSFVRIDTETILHLFTHTQNHFIPISRTLLAWDIITDGKTAAFLQGREFLAFGSLLNLVPEEDLYYANFGDPSVFKYFSNNKISLDNRKYGALVAAYRKYFGNKWYLNGSHINELGYLLCSFPSVDLRKISPATFRDLNIDVLSKLERCSVNQSKTLYNIAINANAYGRPYEWSSHEVGRLNKLFTCIPNEDISSIPLEAISALSPVVMKIINQNKLKYFTKQQILRLGAKTRRIYIIRMQLMKSLDTSQIAKSMARRTKCSVVIFIITSKFIIRHEIFNFSIF